MGNNGEDKPIKTQEELDKERAERFAKDPYSFIEISELICGAIRNSNSSIGISIMVGTAKRSELNNAQVELTHRIELARRGMDIQAEIEHPKIIPGKGSFLNGIRNLGRK